MFSIRVIHSQILCAGSQATGTVALCCQCMGHCATAARSSRDARGNRAAGGWGSPLGGARGGNRHFSGARTRWTRGSPSGQTRPPTGSAVERLNG